jgi:chromosomal replication initiation ATPase DnaA
LRRACRVLTTELKDPDETLMLATYGGFLVTVCPHYGVTPQEVRATSPQRGATADKRWQACAHARQAAIYLTNTALGVQQHRLARALGLTRAAVCLAIRSVEDRRDDKAFDALMVEAQAMITGRQE